MRVTLRGISWDWSCIGSSSYLCDEWDVTTLHDPYMHERLRLGFWRDFQLNKMRAHELTMIMRCGWEREVRNGRMGWVGAASAEVWFIEFHAYDMWGQGLSRGQFTPHSLHAVQTLADGSMLCRTVRHSLLVERWVQSLGTWHWAN